MTSLTPAPLSRLPNMHPFSEPTTSSSASPAMTLAALALTLIALAPLLVGLSFSLRTREDQFSSASRWLPFVQFQPTLQNWQFALDESGSAFVNSLIVSLGAALLAVAVGTLIGYVLAGHRRLALPVLLILLLPRLLPSIVLFLPTFLAFRELRLLNVLWVQSLILAVLVLPFAVFILRDYFAHFPLVLRDAAIADGATASQIFQQVMLPPARPALLAAFVICFAFSGGELLLPLVTTSGSGQAMPVQIVIARSMMNSDFGVLAATALLSAAAPLLLALAVRRYLAPGLSLGLVDDAG